MDDIHGEAKTVRDVWMLSATLQPGDSGGPLVDQSGAVIGVAFATQFGSDHIAYALATSEVQAALTEPRSTPDTGACLR
jgi:S1-C subfamily serine protease